MSNKQEKKIVKITENNLVDLIDNIVTEAVAQQKSKWISEQSKKNAEKNSLLESRITKLEAIISRATVTKK